LGIVGSARRWGNSELVVRQVLCGAREEGAEIALVRLTDLRIERCTGCMRCTIGEKPCPVDDDMAWLIETLQAADGAVLAAPTYWLGPAAAVKLVLDRLLMLTARLANGFPSPRPAVAVVTAGLDEWRGITLPYLNALLSAFGYRPIASLAAIAPGPGEVLLDDELMARLLAAGRRLGRGELDPEPAPPGVCPTCHNDAFTLHGDTASCPICGRQAVVRHDEAGIHLESQPGGLASSRWTPEALREHIEEWVMATGPRFMARRAEIKARRAPYREMNVGWLTPDENDGA
ncbi:MAG: flavodoxin family protein, partial [Anaerolineae bacterium]|nr:flavodoxin family protein [Anaerolineae bacterium]